MTIEDRVRSCLVAGAAGDAWGLPAEGRPPGPVADFPDNPRLSDDTLLTLATCEAIAQHGGEVDPARIADRFRAWFVAGKLAGLGASTLKALRDLEAGVHWALAGAKGEYTAGAGAAMRAAPLAFVLDPDVYEERRTIRDVCRITHHNDEAYAGALAVIVAVRACLARDGVPPNLLAIVAEELPDTAVRDRIGELASSLHPPRAAHARGALGHVVEAVPLALAIASRTTTVEEAIRAAIALGGDTDTIASIAAQIVGASGATTPAAITARLAALHGTGAIVDTFAAWVALRPVAHGA